MRAFLAFVCDPAYGWAGECERRVGTHPIQILTSANLAIHASEYEGRPSRRSLTRGECQDLFDAADERVERIRATSRKGWVPAFRDATMLKVAYGWGLRRHELVMLEYQDFATNPKAAEFGPYGVCHVRHAKATKGSAPQRRGVLTVMAWSVEVVSEWIEDVWPHARMDGASGLWPSERQPRVSEDRLNAAFAEAAAAAGLAPGLSPHCLRHSYLIYERSQATCQPWSPLESQSASLFAARSIFAGGVFWVFFEKASRASRIWPRRPTGANSRR